MEMADRRALAPVVLLQLDVTLLTAAQPPCAAMFHLGHPDILPVGDLGVRKGMQWLYGLKVSGCGGCRCRSGLHFSQEWECREMGVFLSPDILGTRPHSSPPLKSNTGLPPIPSKAAIHLTGLARP